MQVLTKVVLVLTQFLSADQCGDPPTVAIMISGQLQRFIYQDQKGPLVVANPSEESSGCGRPLIDVYIALHNGTLSTPWAGEVSKPPYTDNTTVATIQRWFLEERGANRVFIQIYDDLHLSQMESVVWQEVSPRFVPDNSRWVQFIKNEGEGRFSRYCRMFYMRHLAFSMTFQQQRTYKAYVSLREDNYFFEPLNFTALEFDPPSPLSNLSESPLGQLKPYIMIEKWCKWGGHSDKLHIGNSPGIASLFGRTRRDFIQLMIRWTQYAFVAFSMGKRDPFSTEYFLQDLMATAIVEQRDLKRIDMRYRNGKLCIQPLYYNCLARASPWIVDVTKELNIPKC